MDSQQSPAHIQSLSLQDGAHLDVQLVAEVAAVTPQDAQEPEERQRLGQVDLWVWRGQRSPKRRRLLF